jgi:hypothetical protein
MKDLNASILKASGYYIEQNQTKSVSGEFTYGAEFRGEGKVPLVLKAEAKGNLQRTKQTTESNEKKRLELDLTDVNDIILALEEIEFNKFIVLEDFHYLPVETQRNFSFSLKSFHENSKICFIIIGVWRDKNRLIYYNGDLTNRVTSIDADTWEEEDLRSVLHEGERLLNIQFDELTAIEIVQQSSGTVSLLQEACMRICEAEKINETQQKLTKVGAGADIVELMRRIVDDQAGRYRAFLNNFSEGFQATEYDMYRWILYVVVTTDVSDLESGIRRNVFSKVIKEHHQVGQKLNEGNITQALQSTASLQVQKAIRPIVIDYDQTSRNLNVVDRSFLTWMKFQRKEELLESIGFDEAL